jgi:hypothetical protein
MHATLAVIFTRPGAAREISLAPEPSATPFAVMFIRWLRPSDTYDRPLRIPSHHASQDS